ncbi:MAG TPA: hypothetical protein VNH41_04995 [Steroidobacteraceae bacterium]|nr:hypothetical protein [Steroidobacteraceae bacterium]
MALKCGHPDKELSFQNRRRINGKVVKEYHCKACKRSRMKVLRAKDGPAYEHHVLGAIDRVIPELATKPWRVAA